MLAAFATFLVKIGFGSIIDKTIGLMQKRAELEGDKERLKTQIADNTAPKKLAITKRP